MPNHMDADVCAEAVVKNALKSNPQKNHWIGSGASQIWIVHTVSVLWSTVWVFIIFQSNFTC